MTLFHALGPFAAQAGVVAAPGMVLLTPTSIAHSGTSASIGANGQVTFTAVTSLSLNGVFSADFDNYVIAAHTDDASAGSGVQVRLRASGSDASGSNYTAQELRVDNTTITSARSTSQTEAQISVTGTNTNGFQLLIYGPFLAQPTAFRSITVSSYNTAFIYEFADTHSLSTSYDGITLLSGAASTGKLTVMGVRS